MELEGLSSGVKHHYVEQICQEIETRANTNETWEHIKEITRDLKPKMWKIGMYQELIHISSIGVIEQELDILKAEVEQTKNVATTEPLYWYPIQVKLCLESY